MAEAKKYPTPVTNPETAQFWEAANQGKFLIKSLQGEKVLAKVNDKASPLIARGNAYIGLPDLKDYTIECDVYGTKVRDKDMPDIGVGASRYNLMLGGNTQELTLGTWDALPRLEKKVAFPWKEKTWYRMKLTASVVDGKGVIKGKVWPKGEKELEGWTLEMEDPIPNTEGAAVVVVKFNDYQCPPCRQTLGFLAELKRSRGDGIAVLTFAVESEEKDVREIAPTLAPGLPVALGTPEIAMKFGNLLAVPTLFLFDGEGKLREVFYGASPDLHEKVRRALASVSG